jgi:hypothetical protein
MKFNYVFKSRLSFTDILDIILEVFGLEELSGVDTSIDGVETDEVPEENLEPNQDIDDPKYDEGEKPKEVESHEDGEDKSDKGKDKGDFKDLVSNEGDDNKEQNPNDDDDKDYDDDDDDDDVYIADCEKRKQALIKSSKGASPIEKQRILNEFNVLNDMINNIKNNRN